MVRLAWYDTSGRLALDELVCNTVRFSIFVTLTAIGTDFHQNIRLTDDSTQSKFGISYLIRAWSECAALKTVCRELNLQPSRQMGLHLDDCLVITST